MFFILVFSKVPPAAMPELDVLAINPMIHASDPAVFPVGYLFGVFSAEFSA
jgi:hypothetical protein